MRFRLRTMALSGVLVLGGVVIALSSAHAGCGGGGYGRAWGGHTFGTYDGGYSGGGSGCSMGIGDMNMCCKMDYMNMIGMNMSGNAAHPQNAAPTPAAPAAIPPPPAAPAAARTPGTGGRRSGP